MKKYQVIIILDESRNRSYYQGYVESEDTTLGNITVEELPPYADINIKNGFLMMRRNLKSRKSLQLIRKPQKRHRLKPKQHHRTKILQTV